MMRVRIKKIILICMVFTILYEIPVLAGEIYRWTDKSGTVHYSDLPPAEGSSQAETLRDLSDEIMDRKKQVDQDPDLKPSEKNEKKINIEIDHEKRARAIRNREAKRQDLADLKEKYRKKFDELQRQWDRNFPGSSGRHDILVETERLKREYKDEVQKIEDYYREK